MAAPNVGHILIVEDDGDLLEVLKFVLEDEGYRVRTAEHGADALSIASSQDFSLVLLDISMPDIDGIEVAKRLRADPRTANLRLAIHSALPSSEVRKRFTDYDSYIGKTEDAQELIAAVRAAIEQPPRVVAPSRSEDLDPD